MGEGAVARDWYALRTRSNYEFRVKDRLGKHGIEAFLPTWQQERKWSDRVKLVDWPLFPGYLFARCDQLGLFLAAQVAGVVNILPSNIAPEAIADEEIEALRLVVLSGMPIDRCSEFVVGETVEVLDGPLAGLRGPVVRLKGSLRVVVKVPALGRLVSVEVDAACLQVCEPECTSSSTAAPSNIGTGSAAISAKSTPATISQ